MAAFNRSRFNLSKFNIRPASEIWIGVNYAERVGSLIATSEKSSLEESLKASEESLNASEVALKAAEESLKTAEEARAAAEQNAAKLEADLNELLGK